MADIEAEIFGNEQDDLPDEFKTMSTEDIQRRYVMIYKSR